MSPSAAPLHPSSTTARQLLLAIGTTVVIILTLNAVVSLLRTLLPTHSHWINALIDSVLLSIAAFPALYFFVYTPLLRQEVRREHAELVVLAESEARYLSLFSNMLNGFAYCRMEYDEQSHPVDFTYLEVNRAFERLTGLTNVVGKRVTDVVPGILQLSPELFDAYGRVASTGVPETFEFNFQSHGQWLTISAFSIAKGTFVAVFEDITERRQADDQLRRAEAKYRDIFDHSTDGIYQTAPDGAFITVNAAMAHILRYDSPDDLMSHGGAGRIYATQEGRAEFMARLARDGVIRELEFEALCKDGSRRWVSENVRAVRSAAGTLQYYEGTLQDITDRKQRGLDLTLFRTLLDRSSDGIEVVDPETLRFIDVNDGTCVHLGYSRDELLAMTVRDVDAGLAEADLRRIDDQLSRTGSAMLETTHRRKDGTTFPVEVNISRITLDRPYQLVIVRDITERRNAEAARLRAEEEHKRLATAVEQAAEAILITDRSGAILYVNPAAERSTGYPRAELVGRTPSVFKSGHQDEAFYQNLWSTIAAGNVWTGHFANRRKDGTLYEEDATISPIVDATGAIVNFVAVKRDVTREVQLEQQFRQAQKMEVMGRLAGGVAHDFNNLLTVIIGYSEMILENCTPGDAQHGWATEVHKAGEFATRLTRQLLAFSRKRVMLTEVLDLNALVTQTTRMIARLIGADVRLVSALDAQGNRVKADAGQIEQILLNLAVNARDAMPNGGTLTLATADVVIDQALVLGTDTVAPGRYVELTIRDSGIGMSDDVKAHLFEPFFTTKEQGKGTGLGLAMVYGIVKQSGGHIDVTSDVGRGTTFRILLPRTDEDAATVDPAPVKTLTAGSERHSVVLVADGDAGVRRFVARCLTDLDYTVIEAASGAEAIQAARQFSGDIDLLLADTVLPDFTGHQLRQLLAPTRPALRTLFMTGGTPTQLSFDDLAAAGTAFIYKPFGRDTLAKHVRDVLAD